MTDEERELFRGILAQAARAARRVAEAKRRGADLDDAIAAEYEDVAAGRRDVFERVTVHTAHARHAVEDANIAADDASNALKSLRRLFPDDSAALIEGVPRDLQRETWRIECARVPLENLRDGIEEHRHTCKEGDACGWLRDHEAILAEREAEEAKPADADPEFVKILEAFAADLAETSEPAAKDSPPDVT